MDFSIQSLLPRAQGKSSSTNVVDQDPAQMAEEFAKLLVAQIQNQDPEAPLDPTQIISQNAQFTASLATVRLANQMAHYEQIASTMQTVGKMVAYIDPSDFTETPQVGLVSGANYETSPPSLVINGKAIPMSNILEVGADPLVGAGGGEVAADAVGKLQLMQLLGKNVEYFDASNNVAVGVVDEVDLISEQNTMTINGTSVPMADLIRVIN
ncbi:MAG: hypothetical protein CVV27_08955 [Candidatus Melainabacteria bacterium HGW-Melainabacteria-1]|nr:MAG: hypothetical protein CVV27_08955 [Candidatus Melainabacteria bacterium HGW-Melainabacteria-1]